MNRTTLTILAVLVVSAVIFCGCESKEPSAESEASRMAPLFTLQKWGQLLPKLIIEKPLVREDR